MHILSSSIAKVKNFVNKDCTVKITVLMLNCQRNSLKVVMKTDIFQFDKINTFLYRFFCKQRQTELAKKTSKS